MAYEPRHAVRRPGRPRWLARAFIAAAGMVTLAGVSVGLATPSSASAAYQDTSLQANPPLFENDISLGAPTPIDSGVSVVVTCNGAFMGGQPLSVFPVSQGGFTASLGASKCTPDTLSIGKTGATVDGTYTFTVSASPSPDHNAVEKAEVVVTVEGGFIDTAYAEFVSLKTPNTLYPDIQFAGLDNLQCTGFDPGTGTPAGPPTGEPADPCGYGVEGVALKQLLSQPLDGTWAPTDLPGTLGFSTVTSGLLVPGGSGCASASCAYNWATVSGDENGATASETFSLTVLTTLAHVQTNFGDYVNPFGNGVDVFQQHWVPNAKVVGWTATKGDPATHFIRVPNIHGGFSLEAVNGKDIATGLCVSDPIGSEPLGFLPGQVTLRGCNESVFQGFTETTSGGKPALASDTGAGFLNPNGIGFPLVVGSSVTAWGGSQYRWQDQFQLP